jgi:hypothetical protein
MARTPIVSSRLSYTQKLEICQHRTANPRLSQAKLSEWAQERFSLAKPLLQPAISKILAKSGDPAIMNARALQVKRQRHVQHPQLDAALANWVIMMENKHLNLSYDLIKEKARSLAVQLGIPTEAFKFSNGWMQGFNKHHGFKGFKSHGESGSVDPKVIAKALPAIKAAIAQYARKDIYNMDETGLFYRGALNRTIARNVIEGLKNDKTRITIAFTANSNESHKLEPFFIRHANKPRVFNKKSEEQLGFYYRYNTKAWMNNIFFQEWLQKLEADMRNTGCHILLFMDNAPSHIAKGLDLVHVELFMLPPNTTSKIQPMDAGIIVAFKKRYHRLLARNALDRDERGEDNVYNVDQLIAMRWSVAAWNDISKESIQNCFNHTGLFVVDEIEALDGQLDETNIDREIEEILLQLPGYSSNDVEFFLNSMPEEHICVHEDYTDAELLAMNAKVLPSEEQEEEEDDEEPMVELSLQEKLSLIQQTIGILDVTNPLQVNIRSGLQCVQWDLRR